MANLERRILIMETTHRPQNKLDGVSAAELRERITDRTNELNEQRPDWIEMLISDPNNRFPEIVRRMAMLGFLTPKQSLMLRRHSAMKCTGVTDGI